MERLWDKSLEAAEPYRDVIIRELDRARAVICLWSETSTKSHWVRAEAARASADAKLIPLKVPSLDHHNIPLPFGEMHILNINNSDALKAAIVAQLRRPTIASSELRRALRSARHELLSWLGMIGGAITLFTHLGSVITMAHWARQLAIFWKEWSYYVLTWMFGWLGVRFHSATTPYLVFALLMLVSILTAFAQSAISTRPRIDKNTETWRLLLYFISPAVTIPTILSVLASSSMFDPDGNWGQFILDQLRGEYCVGTLVAVGAFSLVGILFTAASMRGFPMQYLSPKLFGVVILLGLLLLLNEIAVLSDRLMSK